MEGSANDFIKEAVRLKSIGEDDSAIWEEYQVKFQKTYGIENKYHRYDKRSRNCAEMEYQGYGGRFG